MMFRIFDPPSPPVTLFHASHIWSYPALLFILLQVCKTISSRTVRDKSSGNGILNSNHVYKYSDFRIFVHLFEFCVNCWAFFCSWQIVLLKSFFCFDYGVSWKNHSREKSLKCKFSLFQKLFMKCLYYI